MGIERMHSANYFRKRAALFRAKAGNAKRASTKGALREAAKKYADLARRAEQIQTTRR
ncbi:MULTISPECIES: hypothetical protein [Bradyrhizobium]|uniref:hypothetical protein n=1 Tax=Bradyrhizobium TaxID=374 RepID=UPI00040101C3|nr:MULTISPECIES: hypothetical protein [Bradyrhizobium]UFW50467.1 hypothetical protein BaraCB756_05215 [Bradyrhizobium arachidis]